ncbi:MAG: replicative DNA helicase [Planctomycetota bacterium]|jgi:replicative DNA helicase|nr:replicative DNA helicase [Planctomycetia bacterium]RLS29672.1 MAG: replicative DNA helicase [Planctomycetota bacterium]RLS60014.1 MAG: replicative DNA helicase [Planctomycetota bacterium]TSA08607.1 MAG: replicative DNA helicase [Planctomycetaceae bacterium]
MTAAQKQSPVRDGRTSGNIIPDSRTRPSNMDAERAILGSILLKPNVCDDVALVVRPEDFCDESYQILYRHLLAMHDAGKRIDMTLVLERLRTAGDLERIGGVNSLTEVLESVPHAAHATHYADIVRDKAMLRSLIDAGSDILREAYDAFDEPRQLVSRAEERIFSILERRTNTEAKGISDVLQEALSRMDARMKNEHALGGVETGFTELDSLCGGLHNSELSILAARPSMGKTAIAMNIAEHVSMNLKMPVLFVSLEMACLELADRLLCSSARVNGHRLRNGTISQEDRRRLVQKSSEISSAPLFIDDAPGRTLTEIAAVARRLKRKQGLSLIVIDYLQLIEPDNPRDPRQEQVARIARRLKMMSRELDIPVLCLAQLNRQAEASRDNRPRLNHLRESGAIEQDADVVFFVHREEYYQTNDEDRERTKGQAEIIIAKQRNGPVGDIKLLWQSDFTRFVNLEQRPYDEFEKYSGY